LHVINNIKLKIMKAILIVLFASFGLLFITSCTKNDCVCVDTHTIDGVVQSTSSTSSGGTGVPGPAGAAGNSDICNSGDYTSSSTNYQGQLEVYSTECELE
jgi:hypothetical protein